MTNQLHHLDQHKMPLASFSQVLQGVGVDEETSQLRWGYLGEVHWDRTLEHTDSHSGKELCNEPMLPACCERLGEDTLPGEISHFHVAFEGPLHLPRPGNTTKSAAQSSGQSSLRQIAGPATLSEEASYLESEYSSLTTWPIVCPAD